MFSALSRSLGAAALAASLALTPVFSTAADLGIEGQVYEPIEEDFRLMLMRLMARTDWSVSQEELKESARDYTKNLPAYVLPRAAETATHWKDIGIIVDEDINLPWVDWETGSVFEPQPVLAVPAGSYLNPIAQLPSAAIERLFLFDATDPEQLAFAKELMRMNIPQLSFMLVAGDLGPLAEEMNRPVFHPAPSMLEKFQVRAVPSLIGFGRGPHQGHMAVTEIAMPATAETVKKAWFGMSYPGYDPESIADLVLHENAAPTAAQ